MLDEIRELQLYTFDADDKAAFPFEGTLLRTFKKGRKDDFTCIPRALEIVARHCLFFEDADQEHAASRADETIDVLRAWCALPSEHADSLAAFGLEDCREWMTRYIEAYCEAFPGHDEKALLAAWGKRKKGFDRNIFTKRSLTASDVNDASFEAIVGRALRRGPLKRWAMVGKLVPDEACTTDSRKRDGSFAKLNAANSPTVIALTAMCLLGLGKEHRVPRSGFVPINMQELCGWLGRRKEFDHKVIESWLYEGEQLFTQSSEKSGVRSWKVSQTWLDDGQWQLIDITDNEDSLHDFRQVHASEGFRCYEDADYDDPMFTMGPLKSLASFDCDED